MESPPVSTNGNAKLQLTVVLGPFERVEGL
jgi:hypothetical protein